MKKVLLFAAIAFLGSTAVMSSNINNEKIEAQAKSYPISQNFAQNLKQGKLPRSKGKIGMPYKTLVKQKGIKGKLNKFSKMYASYEDRSVVTKDNYVDMYYFEYKNSKVDKVIAIHRQYDYYISIKSFEKYFKKPLKYIYDDGTVEVTSDPTIYKTGKYYTAIKNNIDYNHEYFKTSNGRTRISQIKLSNKRLALGQTIMEDAIDFK